MVAFAVCFGLAAVAPAPRRAPPGEQAAYLALLGVGGVTFAAAAALPLLGLWLESAIGLTSATSMVLVCLWLARSPLSRDSRDSSEDDEEGGGGGRRPPEPPEPSPPSDDVEPHGPDLDWGAFDSQRAGWEAPSRDRELVGV